MARNIFANITARGVKSQFNEAFEAAPQVWKNYCQEIPSDSKDEEYAWAGMVPAPREYVSGRNLVGINDFTYNIANKEYELSFIIDQTSVEDDKQGEINAKIANVAQVWADFHDWTFTQLLENGATAGYTTFTGGVFFSDTGTAIGASGTIDNNTTTTENVTYYITAAEMRTGVSLQRALLTAMADDTGRLGYNGAGPMSKLRLAVPPCDAIAATELANSTAITIGGDSNTFFKGLYEIDELPHHTVATRNTYLAAVGAERKPFIYQPRTALQIEVLNDSANVALHHGVMVLTRQRFRMWYGDPRRMIRCVWT